MARQKRICQSEYPYHAMARTNNKEFRFNRPAEQKEICKIFADVAFKATKKYNVFLSHLVILSNHFHLLLSTPLSNISKFMQYFNARIAEHMNKLQKTSGHLWGDRFKSTIIDSGVYMERILQYIYNNPVRARIAETVMDYEKSTVFFYAFGRPVFVDVSADSYFISMGETDEERREKFIKLIIGVQLTDEQLGELRSGMKKNVYGNDEFVKKIKDKISTPDSSQNVMQAQTCMNSTTNHNLN